MRRLLRSFQSYRFKAQTRTLLGGGGFYNKGGIRESLNQQDQQNAVADGKQAITERSCAKGSASFPA